MSRWKLRQVVVYLSVSSCLPFLHVEDQILHLSALLFRLVCQTSIDAGTSLLLNLITSSELHPRACMISGHRRFRKFVLNRQNNRRVLSLGGTRILFSCATLARCDSSVECGSMWPLITAQHFFVEHFFYFFRGCLMGELDYQDDGVQY